MKYLEYSAREGCESSSFDEFTAAKAAIDAVVAATTATARRGLATTCHHNDQEQAQERERESRYGERRGGRVAERCWHARFEQCDEASMVVVVCEQGCSRR